MFFYTYQHILGIQCIRASIFSRDFSEKYIYDICLFTLRLFLIMHVFKNLQITVYIRRVFIIIIFWGPFTAQSTLQNIFLPQSRFNFSHFNGLFLHLTRIQLCRYLSIKRGFYKNRGRYYFKTEKEIWRTTARVLLKKQLAVSVNRIFEIKYLFSKLVNKDFFEAQLQ